MKVNKKTNSLHFPKNQQDDPYRKVAKKMEENFLNFLIEKMRQAAPLTEDKSTSMSYYKGLLDQQRAKIMADSNGGVGIQDVILRQIAPERYKAQANARTALNDISKNKEVVTEKGKYHE